MDRRTFIKYLAMLGISSQIPKAAPEPYEIIIDNEGPPPTFAWKRYPENPYVITPDALPGRDGWVVYDEDNS